MPLSVNSTHTHTQQSSLFTALQCEFCITLWMCTEPRKVTARIKTTGKYCPLFPGCDKVPAAKVGSSVTLLSHCVTQESHHCSCTCAGSGRHWCHKLLHVVINSSTVFIHEFRDGCFHQLCDQNVCQGYYESYSRLTCSFGEGINGNVIILLIYAIGRAGSSGCSHGCPTFPLYRTFCSCSYLYQTVLFGVLPCWDSASGWIILANFSKNRGGGNYVVLFMSESYNLLYIDNLPVLPLWSRGLASGLLEVGGMLAAWTCILPSMWEFIQ